jgi:hypothetical protein
MTGDPTQILVAEGSCTSCGTPRINVYHQSFPEMRISGKSLDEAVGELVTRLEANVGAVSDPMHRAPVRLAIADVRAFINRDTVPQPKLSEVIQVLVAGSRTRRIAKHAREDQDNQSSPSDPQGP